MIGSMKYKVQCIDVNGNHCERLFPLDAKFGSIVSYREVVYRSLLKGDTILSAELVR